MSTVQPPTSQTDPHLTDSPPAPAPGGQIRVLVCDDDAMVRRALRTYLARVPDIEVVAEAADVHTAQRILSGHAEPSGPGSGISAAQVDIVLLDLRMPGHDADGHALAAWSATQPRPHSETGPRVSR